MTAQPLAQVVDLVRTYGTTSNPVHALRGVTLELNRGQLVALKGRSGSGKTTLLNCLGGLDQPTSGRVLFDGRDLAAMSDAEVTLLRRRRVGYIFQSFALLPLLSARENVEWALRILGMPTAERIKRAAQCLEEVGLTRWQNHRPFELSGGQQQRVAIARALAAAPELILADEPTGELDTRTGLQIMALFRRLVKEHGITICLTTHDPGLMELTDVTYELADGAIREVVRTGEVMV